MSRSGYSDDYNNEWELICWRGAVNSAIKGRRGQAFLREMLAALDKMEAKRLISHDLAKEGEVCAIGSVGKARGIDMSGLDPECYEAVAGAFGIAEAMAREIAYMNDEGSYRHETPEERYRRMRQWIASTIEAEWPRPVGARGEARERGPEGETP